MPTEERGSISHVKPTGWHSVNMTMLTENTFITDVMFNWVSVNRRKCK